MHYEYIFYIKKEKMSNKQPEVYFGTRVREMFARVKAVLDLIIGVKPYFLGTPEPLPMPTE